MSQSWINYAIRKWQSDEIKLNSGTSISLIVDVEDKIEFQFPEDFKELYSEVNGFIDWDWTPTMFSIWPIERILEEYIANSNHNFIGFCDYLINAHCLGFIKNKEGIYKDYGNGKPILIAMSFTEAIELINRDAYVIY